MGRIIEQTTIELFKEAMKFSAAHFTLFSATKRERLHGHDFFVSCSLTGETDVSTGLIADYGGFKRSIFALCEEWDEYLLLPGRSPFLELGREGAYISALFNGQKMLFLADEVRILPVANISLEGLASLFLKELISKEPYLQELGITQIQLKVGAGPGQNAVVTWVA